MPETTPDTLVDPHSTSSYRCSHSNITHFTPSGDRLHTVTFCSHLFVRLSCSHAACTDLPWSLSSTQQMPPHLPQPPLEACCLGSCTARAHRRAPHSEAARDRVAGRRRRRVGTSARALPERRLACHGACGLAWAMELCSVCGRHLAHMLSKACALRVRVADGVRRLTIREALIAVAVHAVLAIPALVLGVDRLALRVLEACD